jgi:hypothetical protein
MTDDNFRSNRSRDAVAPRSAGAPARGQVDDPLAELARLIGQSEPTSDIGRDTRRGPAPAFDEPAGGLDWAAQDRHDDNRYAEENEPTEENYDARDDERYAPARHADDVPAYRPGAPSHDGQFEPPATGQFSAPALRYSGVRESVRDYAAPEQPRYRDEQELPESHGRQLPAFLPRLPAEDHAYDDQTQEGADDQAYALEDHEEEAPSGRRRSGFVVVAAVLGLAVLGTAGAFAYRAMFGDSMLPSLPPIIKADDGPNKIVPKPKPNASEQANASDAGSGEKLVSREEQPVDMPAPVNPGPRVVSTIPVFPDPNSSQAGVPNSAQTGVQAGVLAAGGTNIPAPAPVPVTPAPTVSAQPNAAPSIWPPAANSAPVPSNGAAPTAPVGSAGPKKIHTVIIRSDQMGAVADASSASPPPLPAPVPVRTAPPRAAAQPAPRPPAPETAPQTASQTAPRAEANAPLSIVPDQGGATPAAAPARTRTAPARPAENTATAANEAAPSAGGSYAVQVTSQRSEAAAQTEFRALKAKFPAQLGDHEPIVRRADLGAKGVYYRALVGPYASMDQAAAMCSSLKAAGGTCIVQRD